SSLVTLTTAAMASALTFTGAVTLNGTNNVLTVGGSGVTLAGAVGGTPGAGNVALQKFGAGTLTLTSTTSNYTGLTLLNQGIVNVQTSAALGGAGAGSGTVVAGGATLQLQLP